MMETLRRSRLRSMAGSREIRADKNRPDSSATIRSPTAWVDPGRSERVISEYLPLEELLIRSR